MCKLCIPFLFCHGYPYIHVCMNAKSLQSCQTPRDLMDHSSPSSSVHGILQAWVEILQAYWSGLLCPPPGDLPDPGIKSGSLMSPTMAISFYYTTRAMWGAPPLYSYSHLASRVNQCHLKEGESVSHSVMSNSLQPHGLYSPPGSSIHGIFQARILEWVATPFSRGSSWTTDQAWISCIAGRLFFYCLSFHACVQSLFSHVWIFVTLWTVPHQAPLSMGFSRQESWSQLPCPPPGDLPNPGIEHVPLTSPALAGRFFTTNATWEPHLSLQGSPINITDLLLNNICFNPDLLSHVPWFYYLEIYFPLFLNTHKVAISIYTIKCLFRYLSI